MATLRPQTSAAIADLLAIGVVRVATDGTLMDPSGNPLPTASNVGRVTGSPLTATTVAFNASTQDQVAYLTPAGALAALTVNVPADAASLLGQQCLLVSTQAVTALTLGQTGGGATILGGITALAAGVPITLTKVAANTWSAK